MRNLAVRRMIALALIGLVDSPTIFNRYPKISAIGFATIPSTDEGGLSLAAVNRMIAAAIRGVKARELEK